MENELNRDMIIKVLDCFHKRILSTELANKVYESEISAVIDAIALIKELTEENERLKSVEFTCGFIKPHKVLECPIFDEIGRTKADTVQKMQDRFALHFGTYTDTDTVKVVEVFKLLERVGREILEGDKGR